MTFSIYRFDPEQDRKSCRQDFGEPLNDGDRMLPDRATKGLAPSRAIESIRLTMLKEAL